MICPQCQSENRDDAKFCNECGFPLSGRIAQVAAATAAIEEAEQAAKVERAAVASDEAADELDPDFEGVVSADEPVAEPADDDKPDTSGPLDRATLPAIDVAGVNVDENGNAFDFGSVDDGANDVAPAADDLSAFVPRRPDDDPSATARNDFSGFDECLVDAGYVPPQKTWGPGDTMEMPRIEGQAAPKQKEFRAPDANKKKGGKGKAALIVLACLLVIGVAAAGTTYYLELWGGHGLPDVVGMTPADAASAVGRRGCGGGGGTVGRGRGGGGRVVPGVRRRSGEAGGGRSAAAAWWARTARGTAGGPASTRTPTCPWPLRSGTPSSPRAAWRGSGTSSASAR